ncbi:DEAD/DEAH box helicase family protein [Planococcus lenghuensis]|uniref:Shikimate kinase n=1 Tax=Planococcus lenghuensis TaxID=2213202 RepID=A0A1Q2KXU1_9BACL|nr:hypothetical protein [Planococcus lenghuensis]AQQ52627.1 shikimate kinase [Planococcus lenghuensis]
MKLVLLFGPQAVGKMMVGQELEKLTGLKLFHNHMTIDLLHPFFGFSKEMWRLSGMFREEIFKSVASSELEGLIFTYVWAFDLEEDWAFIQKLTGIFEEAGADVCFVELEADVAERLIHNNTPNRLTHKPTKRNLAESEGNLKETMEKHRLNSREGEIQRASYLRINNTNLSASETAELIQSRFAL